MNAISDTAKEVLAKYLAQSLIGLVIAGSAVAEAAYWDPLANLLVQKLVPLVLAKILLVLFPLLLILAAYCWYLFPKMKFDQDFGAYKNNKTGEFFCTSCHANKKQWVPLRKRGIGLDCMACGRYYAVKNEKPPIPASETKPNGQSWMSK